MSALLNAQLEFVVYLAEHLLNMFPLQCLTFKSFIHYSQILVCLFQPCIRFSQFLSLLLDE